MDRFELFPQKSRLLLGLANAAVLATLSGLAMRHAASGAVLSPTPIWAFAVPLALVATLLALSTLRGLVTTRPAFAADAQGFSVMGKRPVPWDRLASVKLQRLWLGPIPGPAWVVVRSGKGVFAKRQQIAWTWLPGSAKDTAGAILQLAEMAGHTAAK